MQTQFNNTIENELIELEKNNKISILKTFTLYGLFSFDKDKYSFLLAKLRAMLIPPANILDLITDTNPNISIWDKAFELMEKGNEECKEWFNSEGYLNFDFIGLKMDEKFMNLEKMYKNRNENSEAYFKLYKDSLEVLKEKIKNVGT